MLQPKRTKYRKQFKGRNAGLALRGNTVAFGDFGLRANDRVRMTAREIEAARRGKGNVEYWIAKVKPGKVLFEMEGVTEETAREAFRLAGAKLSVRTSFVKRQVR